MQQLITNDKTRYWIFEISTNEKIKYLEDYARKLELFNHSKEIDFIRNSI